MILLKTSNRRIDSICAELRRWMGTRSAYLVFPHPFKQLVMEHYAPDVLTLAEILTIKRKVISILSEDYLIDYKRECYHFRLKP